MVSGSLKFGLDWDSPDGATGIIFAGVKSAASTPARSTDSLAEVETIIVRLSELRQQEPGKERKSDYQAAIDRLHALAHRLERDATPGRVIGLPPSRAEALAVTPASSEPPPDMVAPKPQPNLPLGPVIVRARRPRR